MAIISVLVQIERHRMIQVIWLSALVRPILFTADAPERKRMEKFETLES
jgi:hypothetical protein